MRSGVEEISGGEAGLPDWGGDRKCGLLRIWRDCGGVWRDAPLAGVEGPFFGEGWELGIRGKEGFRALK